MVQVNAGSMYANSMSEVLNYKFIINYSMKERRRYLVRNKTREGAQPSKIREWEVVKVTNDYCKVMDLVNYSEMEGGMFGPTEKFIPKGEETWLSMSEILTNFDILEEID